MSFRDRLRGRQLPQATVAIRIDYSEDSYRLQRELELAEHRLHIATTNGDSDVDQLQRELGEARAAVDAAYEFLTLRAIPAADMESLITTHPPTDEQRERNPTAAFNPLTFYPELLALVVEGPESAEDWATMIESGELVMGEITTLINTAMDLNDRSPNVSLGKGSTTIPS